MRAMNFMELSSWKLLTSIRSRSFGAQRFSQGPSAGRGNEQLVWHLAIIVD